MSYRVYGFDPSINAWVSVFGTDIASLIAELEERSCTQIGVQALY